MTATQAGRLAASVQTPGLSAPSAPSQYLRRVARFIVLRSAVRGRLSWPVALLLLRQLDGGRP